MESFLSGLAFAECSSISQATGRGGGVDGYATLFTWNSDTDALGNWNMPLQVTRLDRTSHLIVNVS